MNSFELDDLRSIGTPVDGKVPAGDPATAWPTRKLDYKLVSPLNRRKFTGHRRRYRPRRRGLRRLPR